MTRRSFQGLFLAALLPIFVPTPGLAKLPTMAQRAADLYLQGLVRVERSEGRISMEPLFVLADSLDDAFFPSILDYSPRNSPWTEQAIANYTAHSVEGLPETELDSLRAVLRGVKVFAGDYVFTYLDTEFFLGLAESHGLPADVDFLKAYASRYLGSESVQDCIHFGTDLIVNQHGAWREFRSRHPQDYVGIAAEEDRNVIEQLMGTCACGDPASVESELDHFLRRFPDDPIAQQVRARLASVRSGASDVTFNCPPSNYH